MNTLFAGIDISKKTNAVCLLQPDGSKYSSFRLDNNPGGVKKLSNQIVAALEALELSSVAIGMESTSMLSDHLVYSLRQDGNLGRFTREIYVLNPKQVKNYKDSLTELPKNDFIDAYVIAEFLKNRHTNLPVYSDDYRVKALQTLTRERFFVSKNLACLKRHFANYAFLKCSGLAMEDNVKNTSATFLAIMQRFASIDDLASVNLGELTEFVAKSGRGRFSSPEERAKMIKAAAVGSYRLPKTVNDSVNQAMSVTIATINAFKNQIKMLDKAIAELLGTLPNPLISIPGIGPVLSAGIIAEIGDIRRFPSQAQLAKYAGLAWLQHQSGEKEFKQKRKVKTGNRILGYYLREGANSVRRHDSEYRQYYEEKLNEDKRFQHTRALSLTTRKFARLVFRLLKEKRMYRELEK